MAVINQYVDTVNRAASGALINPQKAIASAGTDHKYAFVTFEVAAADDDLSVYRLLTLSATSILDHIAFACDALTTMTDVDCGLYRPLYMNGAVVIKDVFMDGQTFAAALDFGFATAIDGMDNVDIANAGRALWEHAGHSLTSQPVTALSEYDIALTATVNSTVAGTVSCKVWYGSP